MKAVIINKFGGPEVLEYIDIPKPAPRPGEVLVKNVAIGVGKPDYLVRAGIYPYLGKHPPMLTIGNECAGYVEAVGEGIEDIRVGMPVWVVNLPGYGAYAEYICVDKKFVTVLPVGVPPEKAPGIGNYFVAYALLNEVGRGTDGKSLYILGGAGGVGTALIKLALLDGWEVISGADTPEKCEYLEKLGTTHVFNCTEVDQQDAIREFTNGRGVDLIYNQWVGPKFFDEFSMLADFGMIVVYNWLDGSPGQDFFPHMVSQAIHVSAVRFFSFHVYDDKPERLGTMQEKVFSLISSGKVVPEFYGNLPLSEVRKAHEMLDDSVIMGKLIMIP